MDLTGIPLPNFLPGWVWLAGAGPGDPALLTLQALHGLRAAEVVVYDALVDPSILEQVQPGCVCEYAGKRGGKPSPKQRDISIRLIELARTGKRVLRLKGGDPFVFGRGGEEALALVEAGVPFRVLPGVTAGIGGLSYAGIPVTHREVNHTVTFLTGHDSSGLVPDAIDWPAVAKGSPVLVMYMALKHLSAIAERLQACGRHASEPLAIVSSATLDKQKVLVTTLGDAAGAAASAGIEPPAMVVLGEVVRLRSGLDWLGALSGRTLTQDPLSTRSHSEVG